jgi:predicted phosphodiesterase
MLEVPIEDVHFGKLSMSEDVAEPYNYNLAKECVNSVVDNIISNVSGMKFEKIIFPVGSDFFHVDNVNCTTTAGTRQDTDLSPQLIFKYGLECLIENILKLSQLAPVEVFCINGNHDFLSSYHAICSLQCFFHNNENVIVNTDTSPRKYIEYGNNLIGFTHGDKEKKRIEGLMQIEAREAWGRTKFHEIHMGHLHSEHVREVNGIIIRNLSSFTGTDAWHHNSGYVGAIKKCQCFIWDKNKGLKNIIMTNFE